MIKLKSVILVCVALLLVTPSVYASPLLDSEDIDAEGAVEAVGSGSIKVDGKTFLVSIDTVITTGPGRGTSTTLSEISVGDWVSISGYEDNSVIYARKIKVKPWITVGDTDPDDEPDDEDSLLTKPEHPIALWMAYRFDLDYEELMEMHGDGMGWGNMVKAYHMAQAMTKANPDLDISGDELLEMRKEGKGWGNITRELDTKPVNAPPAWGRDKERPHHNPNAGPKK